MESKKEQISIERKEDEDEEDERKALRAVTSGAALIGGREDLSYVICDFIQPPYQMIVWEKKKPF